MNRNLGNLALRLAISIFGVIAVANGLSVIHSVLRVWEVTPTMASDNKFWTGFMTLLVLGGLTTIILAWWNYLFPKN